MVQLFAVIALCVNINAWAETAVSVKAAQVNGIPNMLVYIQPIEYTNSIKLHGNMCMIIGLNKARG